MPIARRVAIAFAAAVVLAPSAAGALANGASPARDRALAREQAFRALLRANARPRAAAAAVPSGPVGPTGAGGGQYRTVASVGRIARDTLPPQPGSEPDTQIEPDIAVSPLDPRIVVATFQQGRFPDGASVDPGFATSHDGGVTWRHGNLPHLTTAVGGRWGRATDPVVAFGTGGRVYIQTLVLSATSCDNGVAVQRSDDGGYTWTDPFIVEQDGCGGFNDKNWITVDTSPTSPHRGRLYSVWDRATTKGFPQLLRWSDDRGEHWGPLVHVTDGHADTIGAQPVVQLNGDLTNVYYRYAADGVRLVSKTSHDGGATFAGHVLIDHAQPSEPADMRTGALPSVTVDPVTGHLFAVWQDVRFRTDGLNDVAIARSVNGGRSWLLLGRVNNESARLHRDNFTPDVAARGGRVFVTFRTRSNQNGPSMSVDERFAQSSDDGRSFGDELVLGPSADLRYAAESRGFFLGDYMGVAAGPDGAVHAVWCISAVPPVPERYFQTAWSATIVR
jgi:hypothetical protein